MRYALSDPNTISARVFDDEIVIANFTTGAYYSLRFAAAEIWLGLMAGVPLGQIIQAMTPHATLPAGEFADAARVFVQSLEGERLISPVNRPADGAWEPRTTYGPFDAPAFERFTDMEDLLLLDPIHDVGKTGWPDLLRKK